MLLDIWNSWLAAGKKTKDATPLVDPDDVVVTTQAWISGTRVLGYYGPVALNGFIVYRRGTLVLSRGMDECHRRMQRKAASLGANAILGFELHFDPFATRLKREGLGWKAVGTAARVEGMG